MMDESELRRRFARLREAEQASAPSFAQTYGRARARRGWRAPVHAWPLVIGVAATVAIALVWRVSARSFSPSAVTPTIATWRAPTDVFLRTPGSDLLSAIPALGASVLDTLIPTPTKRGA
jgi:hypothetical protein